VQRPDPGGLNERRSCYEIDRDIMSGPMVDGTKRNRLVVFSGGSAAVRISF